MPDAATWEQWEGRTIVGSDGQRVGRISQVYLDHETGAPTWGSVHTGLFGAGLAFVPLQGGHWQGETYAMPFPAQLCKTAPHFNEDQELTHADQRRLFEHYGAARRGVLGRGGGAARDEGAASGVAAGQDAGGTSAVRSEERTSADMLRSPGETVRLRKTVVSEPVSRTVTVRRDELRIEREPVTAAELSHGQARAELREGVHELTLMQEEPAIEKTMVPVERVRLSKRVRTELR
ncbi:MAG: PRC and DUF2382 domain-containing protein [Candidatus Dormibacteria bacterium]